MAQKKRQQGGQVTSSFKGFGGDKALAAAARRLLKRLEEDPDAILTELNDLAKQHLDAVEVWEVLAAACEQSGQLHWLEAAYEHLVALQPKRSELRVKLAYLYLEHERPFLTQQVLHQLQADFPHSDFQDEFRDLLEMLEQANAILLEEPEFTGVDRPEELAVLHERTLAALDRCRYSEACEYAEAALAIAPNFVPALNNLSTAYWEQNNLEACFATMERTLAADPDNCQARSRQIQCWVLMGDLDRARAAADAFAVERVSQWEEADDWLQAFSVYSFLEELPTVIDLYERASERDLELNNTARHLVACAYCKVGEAGRARQLWRQILSVNPDFRIVQENYADLNRPARERRGPFSFPLSEFLPYAVRQHLVELYGKCFENSDRAAPERATAVAALADFLNESGIASLVPRLLVDGDLDSREMLKVVVDLAESDELWQHFTDYMLSDRGADAARLEIARLVRSRRRLPNGELKFWINGAWQDIPLVLMELDETTDVETHAPEVQQLIEAGLPYLQAGDLEVARPLLEQALAIEPDARDLAFNLAMCDRRDRPEACREQLLALHERHPDYVLAPVELAKMDIEAGDLDAAEAWLSPLVERPTFHPDDFDLFCTAKLQLCLACQNSFLAQLWLALWEQLVPHNPQLHIWVQRISNLIEALEEGET